MKHLIFVFLIVTGAETLSEGLRSDDLGQKPLGSELSGLTQNGAINGANGEPIDPKELQQILNSQQGSAGLTGLRGPTGNTEISPAQLKQILETLGEYQGQIKERNKLLEKLLHE